MKQMHIYRSQFFITLIHSFLIFAILVFIDDGFDVNVEAFIFATGVAVILTYVAIRYFKITITDKSLKGYDCWGKYHTIDWNSITGVKPIRIAGLKYLRIENTDSKRPLWIPHFLDNFSKFKIEVLKRVTNENPLKIYLDEKVI